MGSLQKRSIQRGPSTNAVNFVPVCLWWTPVFVCLTSATIILAIHFPLDYSPSVACGGSAQAPAILNGKSVTMRIEKRDFHTANGLIHACTRRHTTTPGQPDHTFYTSKWWFYVFCARCVFCVFHVVDSVVFVLPRVSWCVFSQLKLAPNLSPPLALSNFPFSRAEPSSSLLYLILHTKRFILPSKLIFVSMLAQVVWRTRMHFPFLILFQLWQQKWWLPFLSCPCFPECLLASAQWLVPPPPVYRRHGSSFFWFHTLSVGTGISRCDCCWFFLVMFWLQRGEFGSGLWLVNGGYHPHLRMFPPVLHIIQRLSLSSKDPAPKLVPSVLPCRVGLG